jgi:hypothetical protein
MTSTTTTTTFQIGETYTTGAADYVWEFTVTARTAKFLTLLDKYGDTSRVGCSISPYDGIEKALPLGRYSLAPVISADRPA